MPSNESRWRRTTGQWQSFWCTESAPGARRRRRVRRRRLSPARAEAAGGLGCRRRWGACPKGGPGGKHPSLGDRRGGAGRGFRDAGASVAASSVDAPESHGAPARAGAGGGSVARVWLRASWRRRRQGRPAVAPERRRLVPLRDGRAPRQDQGRSQPDTQLGVAGAAALKRRGRPAHWAHPRPVLAAWVAPPVFRSLGQVSTGLARTTPRISPGPRGWTRRGPPTRGCRTSTGAARRAIRRPGGARSSR